MRFWRSVIVLGQLKEHVQKGRMLGLAMVNTAKGKPRL
jgi:hypothetical protein